MKKAETKTNSRDRSENGEERQMADKKSGKLPNPKREDEGI
jgi:hypothetical protein